MRAYFRRQLRRQIRQTAPRCVRGSRLPIGQWPNKQSNKGQIKSRVTFGRVVWKGRSEGSIEKAIYNYVCMCEDGKCQSAMVASPARWTEVIAMKKNTTENRQRSQKNIEYEKKRGGDIDYRSTLGYPKRSVRVYWTQIMCSWGTKPCAARTNEIQPYNLYHELMWNCIYSYLVYVEHR